MAGISKKNKKTRRPLARNPFPLTGKQDSFKNVFPLGRKIKLAVARASENTKKWFPPARKPVSTSRNGEFV